MNERLNQQPAPQESEVKLFSVRELINEGKIEILARQLEGNKDAMVDIFGKEVTIDQMDEQFKKGITSEQSIKIMNFLGYRGLTPDEFEKIKKMNPEQE